ncbi:hypothetical protein CO051_07470 [Candidatus Roizmanbacteria bacterium CG_4_9_14_0_2_um_filter_39_13]|uniref:Glutamine amidotransferase type-2 domain-containing protein n=2 Tax=Candidatus Roizmaniibacteriota TaxID=1752723 RepID=A0A2M8EW65_9BACT|nr:MAG: hypothetical protein COY15_01780 [Candidatus Roizmanbacteria bacterium CG_4_10_14_0_2_um_filter_39_12]PJC30107.1 MAG: hypothetical protein CO051_07470 [Candidatus Roizmanbacteria bacterium CG_4_9_14_0_2_um_filter_39_13]PJE61548.1 MAG: hypothetical protein COU87_04100 [Candidatus Roizmanbacteria bacterium CG10_big_fil_rev_8_21_14_0_10_39_12]
MCRFLLLKSKKKQNPIPIIEAFAYMAKKSKSYDGDWQGDGWGASWWNDGKWEQYVSLKPVWEDRDMFSFIPPTNHLVLHARSSSFPKDKESIGYNQPFVQGKYAFVFNGLLKGVSVPYPLEGSIGSQKIWSLVQKYLMKDTPQIALEKTVRELNKHTRFIQALNIGLSDGKNIYAYTQYATYPQYYHLGHSTSKETTIVVSEQIEGYEFEAIKQSLVTKW